MLSLQGTNISSVVNSATRFDEENLLCAEQELALKRSFPSELIIQMFRSRAPNDTESKVKRLEWLRFGHVRESSLSRPHRPIVSVSPKYLGTKSSESQLKFGDAMVSYFQGIYW
jgi:hypothetical protein